MYRLIIVDDEEFILSQLSRVFRWEQMGFTLVGCFTNTEDALKHARENTVDVLLSDIQLGNDTGFRLCVEIREITPKIELVLLSAHSSFEYARTALRINVFDYLLKPVTYEAVSTCFTSLREKLDSIPREEQESFPAENEESSDNYRIALIKQYIEKHVGEDISLAEMSGLISMNPAYFSRFFKKHTGIHFADYLAERRMERAIELLRDPHQKIFEICIAVGYFSKQNFYRRFRQHTGRTPNEYRNEVLKIQDTEDEEE